jgi:hypothetical protein
MHACIQTDMVKLVGAFLKLLVVNVPENEKVVERTESSGKNNDLL